MIIRTYQTLLILLLILTFAAPASIAQNRGCSDYTAYLRWVTREMPPPGPLYPVVNAVTVRDDLAYVAAGPEGLAVYDVSDPAQPVLLGMADTPYYAMHVVLEGDLAFVADWHSPGFCVVDVSDPYTPAVIGSDGNTYNPNYWRVAVADPDTVYVVDSYEGIRVIDVSTPTAPDVIGLIPVGGYPWDLEVDDGHLYVVDDINGLHIFDTSLTTYDPFYVSTCPLPATSAGVDVVGDIAYVACTTAGLQVIDIHDKVNPEVIAVLDSPDIHTTFIDVHVVDGMAAVVCSGGSSAKEGLLLVDVTEPSEPRVVNSLGLYYQYPNKVFSTGSHAYFAAKGKGFFVADLTNPHSPPFAGSFVEEDYLPRAVEAAGDYAYVLDSLHGLRVMDLTTPAPAIVGHVDLPGGSHQITLQGSMAYVADGSGGLQLIDVSTPTAPVPRGLISPFGAQYDVAVQGDYAYLASDTYGMHVIDVSDPDTPVERGSVDPSYSSVYSIDVADDHAFITCGWDGLYSIDVSNPDLPVEADHLTFDGYAAAVHVAGDLAFVAGRDDGVFLVDVSDPANLTLVSTLMTPGYAVNVVMVGDLAYIADTDGGIQIADYADPANPRHLGCVDTPHQYALDLAVVGTHVCVAEWTGGFHVLPTHCVPSGVTEGLPQRAADWLTVQPNPFNPLTSIGFTLDRSESVRITVYSLDGRPVRRLAERVFPAGTQNVPWNGRDDAGRLLPSGTYLVNLEGEGGTMRGRVTLLK